MLRRILIVLIGSLVLWGALIGSLYLAGRPEKEYLPVSVVNILRDAEQWHVYRPRRTEQPLPESLDPIFDFLKVAEERVIAGSAQQETLLGILKSIEDQPAGERIIIAAIGWAYGVTAQTSQGQVPLLFKSTGEAVRYESYGANPPVEGHVNLQPSWRIHLETAFACGEPTQ